MICWVLHASEVKVAGMPALDAQASRDVGVFEAAAWQGRLPASLSDVQRAFRTRSAGVLCDGGFMNMLQRYAHIASACRCGTRGKRLTAAHKDNAGIRTLSRKMGCCTLTMVLTCTVAPFRRTSVINFCGKCRPGLTIVATDLHHHAPLGKAPLAQARGSKLCASIAERHCGKNRCHR